MKRPILDTVGRVTNIILTIFYIPLSMFSLLLLMASEATMGSTNKLFISLINIFCHITVTIPLITIISIVLSIIIRNKGKSILSFCVQFLPILIFSLNLILLSYAESIT